MTDSTPPTPARLFRGLTLPQALVILGVLALGGWLAYLLPEDTLTRAVIGVLTALGVAGTALPGPPPPSGGSTSGGALTRPEPWDHPPAPPLPPPSDLGRSGHAHADALLWAAALGAVLWTWLTRAGILGALVLGLACTGCGAGAIATQARAATIATVALEGAHRVALNVTDQRLAECEDEACAARVGEALAPVTLAYEAARAGLGTWVEAIQIAQVAGEDGDVVLALLTAAARWIADLWPPLVAAIEDVADVDLPELPPLVTGLLAGLGGAR